MREGWIWELLGFTKTQACVRLWRVDDKVLRRQIRPGVQVRLVTPSHGAATDRWVLMTELFSGEGWECPGTLHRIMLGPDVSKGGVCREIIRMFTQPPVVCFKSEMEIDLLSRIHEYSDAFRECSIFTDGSVVQEKNPVINVFIPSPSITRSIGESPLVAGAMVARPSGPVMHGLSLAFRAEDGQAAGCGNSYDIEMVMLTLACLVRDQLRMEDSPLATVWSDCKGAVDKAVQIDLASVRKKGHKEHGLLLRRMFHSRAADNSLLCHVKGHPERRLLKGQRWQELSGTEAGIYLADKIADAKMSDDTRFVWENDGSIRAPLVTIGVVDILRLFASIDLWSVVDTQGVPILDSPVARVQARRFARYLHRRDEPRDDKIWTRYVTTAPAAVFAHERLYHRRAKVTKVVFNWYLRVEHIVNGAEAGQAGALQVQLLPPEEGQSVEEQLPTDNRHKAGCCLLCGEDVQRDTERHLYSSCRHDDIRTIRGEAEAQVQGLIAELPEGQVKATASRLQSLLLDAQVRHRVWKGIITPEQVRWISEGIESISDRDRDTALLSSKVIKSCLRVVGVALLAIRKAAWKVGGTVSVRQSAGSMRNRQQGEDRGRTGSVATLLGIMSPKESVCWELARRERRGLRQSGGSSKEAQVKGAHDGITQWDVH